jgi:SAM-dependent methyltransferase
MYFPEKIISIKESFKVLEVGPGASPHPMSNVFLEKKYATEKELIAQSGHVGILITDKPVHFYDGGVFPFENDAFDYVICSHVLEHVPDIPFFLSEIFRVSKMGYFEFPTIYYDYIFNIPEHLNILKFSEKKIFYASKQELGFGHQAEVQKLFYLSMFQSYGDAIIPLYKDYFFQGFEWHKPFKIENSKEITNYTCIQHELDNIPQLQLKLVNSEYLKNPGIKNASAILLNSIKEKIFR